MGKMQALLKKWQKSLHLYENFQSFSKHLSQEYLRKVASRGNSSCATQKCA